MFIIRDDSHRPIAAKLPRVSVVMMLHHSVIEKKGKSHSLGNSHLRIHPFHCLNSVTRRRGLLKVYGQEISH